jgi:hypothetical protein
MGQIDFECCATCKHCWWFLDAHEHLSERDEPETVIGLCVADIKEDMPTEWRLCAADSMCELYESNLKGVRNGKDKDNRIR